MFLVLLLRLIEEIVSGFHVKTEALKGGLLGMAIRLFIAFYPQRVRTKQRYRANVDTCAVK